MNNISFGTRQIGEGHPPLFLPDIGTFFNRDIDLAVRMIQTLKNAGVEIAKGEILQKLDFALEEEYYVDYYSEEKGMIRERYRDLIARKVLSLEQYEKIFSYCNKIDLPFIVSVYDYEGADFAKALGAIGLKVASSNIVHAPLIEYISKLGLPVIIDTGKASLEEICRAYQWAKNAGSEKIVIEYSPPAPPASLDLHNLKMIQTMGKMFSCPIGLSDHHSGSEVIYAAIALGAKVIEKGVTPDESLIDQDVGHALPISQVQNVVRKCNDIYKALGSGMSTWSENSQVHPARMGLIAKTDLNKGEKLSNANVDFAWPALGIPVEHWPRVNGSVIEKPVKKNSIIRWSDVKLSD